MATGRETIIDFSKLPKEEELDLTNFKPSKIEEDFKNSEPEDEPQKKKTKNELVEDEDNDVPIADFALELDEEDLETDVEEDTEESERVQKKSEAKKRAEETELDEEESEEQTRKSRAQERIRELANKNKTILQEKIAREEKIRQLEKELVEVRKRSADTDLNASQREISEAKYAYAKAVEEGDPIKVAEEMVKLNQATIRGELAKAKKQQAEALEVPEDDEESTKAIQREIEDLDREEVADGAPLSQEGENWLSRNKFLFADQNLLNTAGFLFEQVQEDGYDPNTPEAYEELQDRMVGLFPNLERLFSKPKAKKKPVEESEEPKKKPQAPPVSSTSRQAGPNTQNERNQDGEAKSYKIVNGKVKAKPTPEDKRMAAGMGIELADYMKQKIKREMAEENGSKYTQIM